MLEIMPAAFCTKYAVDTNVRDESTVLSESPMDIQALLASMQDKVTMMSKKF
jgi:hypothetical protein